MYVSDEVYSVVNILTNTGRKGQSNVGRWS